MGGQAGRATCSGSPVELASALAAPAIPWCARQASHRPDDARFLLAQTVALAVAAVTVVMVTHAR